MSDDLKDNSCNAHAQRAPVVTEYLINVLTIVLVLENRKKQLRIRHAVGHLCDVPLYGASTLTQVV